MEQHRGKVLTVKRRYHSIEQFDLNDPTFRYRFKRAHEDEERQQASTAHEDGRKMLEQRACGCSTPLTGYMWDVDEEVG